MKKDNYNIALYHSFCDYLFLSKNINKDIDVYKKILVDSQFIPYFLSALDEMDRLGGYPEYSIYNIKKILAFLKINSLDKDNIEKLKYINTDIFKKSNNIYDVERKMKENSLLAYKKNIRLSEDEIVESLKCDFITILSLKADLKSYSELYKPYFTLNKNYIYSINKLLYKYPDLLLNSSFKQRIKDMLETNKKILKNKNMDTVKLYAKHNTVKFINKNNYCNELKFMEESNNNTLIGVNNNSRSFNVNEFIIYHNYLSIESYLNGLKVNIDADSLNDIYCYIDNLKAIYQPQQEKLITLLNIKNKNLDTYQLDAFNEYYKKVINLKLLSKKQSINEFINRCPSLEYAIILHKFINGNSSEFNSIASSYKNDLYIFEFLAMNDKDYSRNIMLFNFKEILYSLQKIMNEYPGFFSNSIIYERTKDILNKYKGEYLGKKLSLQFKKIKKA